MKMIAFDDTLWNKISKDRIKFKVKRNQDVIEALYQLVFQLKISKELKDIATDLQKSS